MTVTAFLLGDVTRAAIFVQGRMQVWTIQTISAGGRVYLFRVLGRKNSIVWRLLFVQGTSPLQCMIRPNRECISEVALLLSLPVVMAHLSGLDEIDPLYFRGDCTRYVCLGYHPR